MGDKKLDSMKNLSNFIARSEYNKRPGISALALFNGEEIVKKRRKTLSVVTNLNKTSDDQDNDDKIFQEQEYTENWEILPILLNNPTENSSNFSVYSQAL